MDSHRGSRTHIDLGGWTEQELDTIIREASGIEDDGSRIAFLSGYFLGLEYRESTLIGDSSTAEVFVINLSGMDCFTFIEYIEAMRLSASFDDFRKNLQQVRYRSGIVSFENRRHFFTDWTAYETATVEDITAQIGGANTIRVQKTINRKEDGTPLLPGIMLSPRMISYIASAPMDESATQLLETGDYAGIFSATEGLDVSHVGIIIKEGDRNTFRHASSDPRYRKVIDQDLHGYISEKPGLIILRHRSRVS